MNSFKIVASSNENTVVAEYTPEERKSTDYQSEAELEKDFINRLVNQGYEYITIKSEQDLIDNLRTQLEKLNNYTFSIKNGTTFTAVLFPMEMMVLLRKLAKYRKITCKTLPLITVM